MQGEIEFIFSIILYPRAIVTSAIPYNHTYNVMYYSLGASLCYLYQLSVAVWSHFRLKHACGGIINIELQ